MDSNEGPTTTEEDGRDERERELWSETLFETALRTLTPRTTADDDLALAASRSLAIGPAAVSRIEASSAVLPRKLHPSLYDNSLGDSCMAQRLSPSPKNDPPADGGGVPGFPNFPDCWQGETGAARDRGDVRMGAAGKRHARRWKASAAREKREQQRQQRRRRRVARKAVNAAGTGKEAKRRLRAERSARRREKVEELRRRRERKREMGKLCRGLASISCK